MDWYDFYGFKKYVIAQDFMNRLIYIRSSRTKEKILIREYCDYRGVWKEQHRIRFNESELKAISEIIK